MLTREARLDAAGAMRLSDFERLERGTVVVLHYNDVNRGTMIWEHDRVEGDQVFGRFAMLGGAFVRDVDRYLYEHAGYVCSGSGADVVCREMPDAPGDDEGEG